MLSYLFLYSDLIYIPNPEPDKPAFHSLCPAVYTAAVTGEVLDPQTINALLHTLTGPPLPVH